MYKSLKELWLEGVFSSLGDSDLREGQSEGDCYREVALAFRQLSIRAGRMAEGKRVKRDGSSEDRLSRLAARANAIAAENHFNDKWGPTPDPCAELGKALSTSARLDAMPRGKAKRDKARRMEVEWARLSVAAEMQAKYLIGQMHAAVEVNARQADAEVQIAELKLQLASSEEDREKAKNDLVRAKDDLAKAQDNRALLESLVRGQDKLIRGQEKIQTSEDRIEGKVDGHEATLQKLPGAVSDALYSRDNYPPTMLKEGQKIRKGFKRGKQKSYDWGPLLKKYGYPTDVKKQQSFLRTLQNYAKRKRK